jgi:hypothetical protein
MTSIDQQYVEFQLRSIWLKILHNIGKSWGTTAMNWAKSAVHYKKGTRGKRSLGSTREGKIAFVPMHESSMRVREGNPSTRTLFPLLFLSSL